MFIGGSQEFARCIALDGDGESLTPSRIPVSSRGLGAVVK